MPEPQHELPVLHVVGGAITDGDRVLISQRRPDDSYPLRWEFPGGKVEPGEDDATALIRELDEELGVIVEVGALVARVLYPLTRVLLDLRVYRCRLVAGDPRPVDVHDVRWVRLGPDHDDTLHLSFPPADGPVLERLRADAAERA